MRKFLALLLIPFLFGFQNFHRALEPETVAYYTLGNSDGTSQFTLNEQMKSLKYNGGIVTLSGLTCNLSLVNGTAFITNPSVDLRKYVGYKISITETTDTLVGWIKSVGSGEALSGIELITNGNFSSDEPPGSSWNRSAAWVISGGVCNADGSGTDNSLNQLINPGQYKLIKLSGDFTRVSGSCNLGSVNYPNNQKLINITGTYSSYNTNAYSYATYWGVSSGYTSFKGTIDNISMQQVTAPSTSGVTIVSTQNGSTYNWTSGTATILPNAASFTAVISAQ